LNVLGASISNNFLDEKTSATFAIEVRANEFPPEAFDQVSSKVNAKSFDLEGEGLEGSSLLSG